MPAKGMAAKQGRHLPTVEQPTMTPDHFLRIYAVCRVLAEHKCGSTTETNEHLKGDYGIDISDEACSNLIREVRRRDQAIFADIAAGGSVRSAVQELENIEARYKKISERVDKMMNDPASKESDIQNWMVVLERLTNLRFAVIQNFVIYPQILEASGQLPHLSTIRTVPRDAKTGRGGSADDPPLYELPAPDATASTSTSTSTDDDKEAAQ